MEKLVFIVIVCWACGGKLSDEERQKLHEGMATQDIKRVTDADLQEAAMVYSKSVLNDVLKVDKYLNQKSKIDSIATQRHVRIYSLIPNDSTLREIETQLIEAYIAGADTGQAGDNLQKAGEDSLLYTVPIFKNRPDGSQQFSHAIGIKVAKKTIVLSIPKR